MTKIKLVDVSDYYPNLAKAEGQLVECSVKDFDDGTHLYNVEADTLRALGCDVGKCGLYFPFFDTEVEVIEE